LQLRIGLIFRPNDHYDGVVLYGHQDFIIKSRGQAEVAGLSETELKDDLSRYSFHIVSVEKILAAAGITTVTADQVTTMRQLRSLVFASGRPTGPVQNTIEKHLDYVSFYERPEPVNASTIDKFFGLMSNLLNDDDGLYLDRAHFFETGRIELVLSMFGRRVPSPTASQGQRIYASPNAHGGGSNVIPYSAVPPVLVAFQMTIMRNAAPSWRSVLESGIMVIPKSDISGGKNFRGKHGKEMWATLNKGLERTVAEAIMRKKTSVSVQQGVQQSRGTKRAGSPSASNAAAVKAARPKLDL